MIDSGLSVPASKEIVIDVPQLFEEGRFDFSQWRR